MKFKPLSRRTFLRGAGVAIALPHLPSLMGDASAQATAVAGRRLVLMFSPCGTVNRPASGGVLDSWTPVAGPAGARSETNFAFAPGSILEPLTPLQSELLVLDNLDLEAARPWGGNGDAPCAPGGSSGGKMGWGPGDGHQPGIGAIWTGSPLANANPGATTCRGQAGLPLNASIDQLLASRIAAGTLGLKPSFSHLAVGVRNVDGGSHGRTVFSSTQSGGTTVVSPIGPENDPVKIFNRLFTPQTGDAIAQAKRRAERKKVLDAVLSEIQSVNNDLSSEDKARLDKHLTSINELENQLTGMPLDPTPSCQKPTLGTLPTGSWYLQDANLPQVAKLQLDLTALALACNLTRVVTVQFTEAQSLTKFSFLEGAGKPAQAEHHSMSHDYGTHWRAIVEVNRWYAAQFAYLVGKLKGMSDGAGGNMLSNTVLAWGNELGQGFDHNVERTPFILAGRGGIRPGRYVDCRRSGANARHNALLVSLCQAMGASDVNQVGLAAMGSGPLANLT